MLIGQTDYSAKDNVTKSTCSSQSGEADRKWKVTLVKTNHTCHSYIKPGIITYKCGSGRDQPDND